MNTTLPIQPLTETAYTAEVSTSSQKAPVPRMSQRLQDIERNHRIIANLARGFSEVVPSKFGYVGTLYLGIDAYGNISEVNQNEIDITDIQADGIETGNPSWWVDMDFFANGTVSTGNIFSHFIIALINDGAVDDFNETVESYNSKIVQPVKLEPALAS